MEDSVIIGFLLLVSCLYLWLVDCFYSESVVSTFISDLNDFISVSTALSISCSSGFGAHQFSIVNGLVCFWREMGVPRAEVGACATKCDDARTGFCLNKLCCTMTLQEGDRIAHEVAHLVGRGPPVIVIAGSYISCPAWMQFLVSLELPRQAKAQLMSPTRETISSSCYTGVPIFFDAAPVIIPMGTKYPSASSEDCQIDGDRRWQILS